MTIYPDLKGKNVLITGAGIGIGKGIALAFGEQGANLALHYYDEKRERSGIEELVQQFSSTGIKVGSTQADFRDSYEPGRLVSDAILALGSVDIVINNSSITLDTPFDNVSAEIFDTLYHVNVRAMLWISGIAALNMRKHGGGAIVNLSSIHAFGGIPGHCVYAGTKGAINSMTQELAVELARDNIRVNAIAPAGVEVPRQIEVNPSHTPEGYGKVVPLGMISYPVDIANAALFLSSQASRCITGQIIRVDGGVSAVPGIGTLHARIPDIPLERQPYLQ